MAMTLEQLKDAIDNGEIDTVVVAAVDMQAGLKGRQMTARHFLQESVAHSKMNISTYFLTSTIEGMPADGYEIGSWEQGFNDCHLIPDLGTIRRTPWVEATALVIADPQLHKLTAEPLYCSPRVILRQQVQRLAQCGLKGLFASELEFHLFAESRESARQKRWQGLQPGQPHWQWMNVGVSAPTEPFMRRVRNQLEAAGILMEATHPEYAPSQQELNFVPAAPLEMADRHILTKQAIHELARQAGLSATFMAKYSSTLPGSSCHIHMSLLNADTGKSVFYDPADKEFGMSQLMRHWLAGLIKYAPECTIFFAPYLNSYKRMQPNSFAPTKRCWAVDNRTSAFRLCAEQSSSVHVEVRVGGADLNPYLAYAALIAAGLAGLDEELPLEPPAEGNIYSKSELPDLPHSLREATVELAQGKMLPNAFGEKAVKHYLNAARHEQAEFDKQVTDWELMRGFDRC